MARSGGSGPEAPEQRVGIEAVEQLHDVVEGAVGGDPEIEQLHRVGRAEAGDHLRFALEPADRFLRHSGTPSPGDGGPDELDGGGPRQHAMPGPPDLSHSSLAELLLQAVAPQLARALDLGAQLVDHARTDIRHAHHEQVGEHEPEEELRRIDPERGGAGRDHRAR